MAVGLISTKTGDRNDDHETEHKTIENHNEQETHDGQYVA